jgi:hypothetical protein
MRFLPLLVAAACAQPTSTWMPQPAPPPPAAADRHIAFNGRALDPAGLAALERLEEQYGRRLPDGAYWYDPACGAAGLWRGPQIAILPAGLELGGPLPPEASGGGDGRLTGIFINGRELHPIDKQNLIAIFGQAWPGRWHVDGHGNAGPEGGPVMMNLYLAARQRAQPSESRGGLYRSDRPGESLFVSQGCVMASGKLGDGTYDYSAGCD